LVVLAGAAAATLAVAPPALASSGRWGAWRPASTRLAPLSQANSASRYFAGWRAESEFSGVTMKTTVVLPKLTCATTKRAIVPSVGSYFEAVDFAYSSAGMFVGCSRGKARYFPALVMNGEAVNAPGLHAKPGDTVVLTSSVKPAATTLSVLDKTTKSASLKRIGAGVGTNGTVFPFAGDASWPFAATTPDGVPSFGKLKFSHTTENGSPFGTDPGAFAVDRYNGPTLQISTGPFASDSETFKTVLQHS
jgi:hypothetical protein